MRKTQKSALIEANHCNKKRWVMLNLMAFMVVLIVLPNISALELNPFADKKIFEPKLKEDMPSFIKDDFNSQYGVIRISKTSFWVETDKIAEYSLIDNTEQCLIDCSARGKAVLYFDGKLFEDMNFKDIAGRLKQIDYKIYLKGIEKYDVELPDKLKEVCEKIDRNGTGETLCWEEVDTYKTETREREIWSEYTGDYLKSGNYEWKIEGKKKPYESVDWIGTARGKEFNEWAWWNSSWQNTKLIDIKKSDLPENYTIKILVQKESNMQDNFCDLRFINNSGGELYHWIEFYNSSGAIVFVKSNTNNTINMYYGNNDAICNDDFMQTFYFSDDFNDNNLNSSKWSSYGTSPTESGGRLVIPAVGGGAGRTFAYSTIFPGVNWTFGYNLSYTANSEQFYHGFWNNSFTTDPLGSCWASNVFYGDGIWTPSYYWNMDDFGCGGGSLVKIGTRNHFLLETHNLANDGYLFMGDIYYNQTHNATKATGATSWRLIFGGNPNNAQYIDWAYVRPIVFPEPLIIFGAEEISDQRISTTTQSYPQDGYNTTDSTPDLSCNFTGNEYNNISSVKILVYDNANNLDYTNTDTGNYGVSYNKTWTTTDLTDDTYKWACFGYGDGGKNSSTSNRTFTKYSIDVTLNAPADASTQYNNPVLFNASMSGSVTDFTNATLFINGVANETLIRGTIFDYFVNDTIDFGRTLVWGETNSSNVTEIQPYNLNYTILQTFPGKVGLVTFDSRSIAPYNAKMTIRFYYTDGSHADNQTSDLDQNNYAQVSLTNPFPDMMVNKMGFIPSGTTPNVAYLRNVYFNITGSGFDYYNNFNVQGSFSSGETITWNIYACDSYNECGFAPANYTFTMDSSAPTIEVLYPNGTIPYGYAGQNISLNYSIVDTNVQSCWYDYNGTNLTIPCTTNSTFILSSKKNFNMYANDSLGNLRTYAHSWNYEIFENERIFNDTTFTSALETFAINLTSYISDPLVVNLIYNGTTYLTSLVNGLYTRTIYADIVGNNTFYWTIDYGNESLNTSVSYQNVTTTTVMEVNGTSCPAGLSLVMNFTFMDEINLTRTHEYTAKYNFKYGVGNTSAIAKYGTLTNTSQVLLCLNTSQAETYLIGYGEIDYVKTGYSARRYYVFETTRLTNRTINTTLYSLPNGDSTSFLVEIRTPTLTPYVEKYTTLLRWYPGLNEYKVVEMGKTDDKGQTVKKVKIEDVDYRLGVYHLNGSLIYLANPIRMVCLVSPCSYTLTVKESETIQSEESYGVETDLTFGGDTFTLVYNDPSQNTERMELRVYQIGSTSGDTLICNSSGTSFTGILNCNVSAYSGLLKAGAFRTASPERSIAMLIVDTATTLFQGKFGLFIQFMITLTLIFLGIISPITSIILGILSLVFGAFLFKTITYPILIGIAILGGIVIHLMRRSSTQ